MSRFAALLRHQTASVVATVVDFSVMIVMVSAAGAGPEMGTTCGAASGALLNFVIGRRWVFRATTHRTAPEQAGRYALVSLSSLLLNTAGMHVLASQQHVHYVAARAAIAILVSILWNFPMQRTFVFGAPENDRFPPHRPARSPGDDHPR